MNSYSRPTSWVSSLAHHTPLPPPLNITSMISGTFYIWEDDLHMFSHFMWWHKNWTFSAALYSISHKELTKVSWLDNYLSKVALPWDMCTVKFQCIAWVCHQLFMNYQIFPQPCFTFHKFKKLVIHRFILVNVQSSQYWSISLQYFEISVTIAIIC